MTAVRLGLRANARQFTLLVGLNALVGAMVGLERSVLPLVGKHDFGLRSTAAILAFVVAFGAAKAASNLVSGELAERIGRKRLLVLGWAVALPVAPLIALAPSWWFVVVANVLLGINQGFAWSMTVVMKIDLAGPQRRGLALGLNEAAGYLGLAAAAFVSGVLAASYAPRTVVWIGAGVLSAIGLLISVLAVRDTGAHVAHEQQEHGDYSTTALGLRTAFVEATVRNPVLRACSQAGMVNNLNDALAWGLAPLYLAAHGASLREVAVVAATYPVVWGAGQLVTGWLSDRTGRKPLIAAGMLVQAAALALLVAGNGAFAPSLVAAVGLGVGTAMVYPTLIAAVSDASQPRDRARTVGVYRFWRDFGFVLGALIAGFGADATSPRAAIAIVAALTAASGLVVVATSWQSRPALNPTPSKEGEDGRQRQGSDQSRNRDGGRRAHPRRLPRRDRSTTAGQAGQDLDDQGRGAARAARRTAGSRLQGLPTARAPLGAVHRSPRRALALSGLSHRPRPRRGGAAATDSGSRRDADVEWVGDDTTVFSY